MLKLTRRGWNNVLIFATLFMILLFNMSDKIMQGDDVKTFSLGEYAQIQAIDFGQVKLQRIGRGWRATPALNNEYNFFSLISTWQQMRGELMPGATLVEPYVVSVLLAGEDAPRVFQLLPQGEQSLLQYQSEVFIIAVSIDQLIPQELL